MYCPVCQEVTLVMTERQGIEIDYCPQCRGVWLDRGELDKIIERAGTASAGAPGVGPAVAPATQQPYPPGSVPPPPPAPRHYDDDDDERYKQHPGQQPPRHKKKRKNFFEDLFDFD